MIVREDSFRHKGLRQRLVQELQKKGITHPRVLEAIGRVPRHLFIDPSFSGFAYQDKAFPIGAGQTISQPYTVALQSQLLEVQPGEKILEVGTGSGYQAAVLVAMGAKLFSIERQKELYDRTASLLPKLGFLLRQYWGDGYQGLPDVAPFDKIIVTAGAPYVPKELLTQLKVGGLMVIPVGENRQVMTRIRRLSDIDFEKEAFGDCAFVPMLNGIEKK
ncbi:protein-L-isoaspartate(D-aspartate) O-methyltransferase [Breznakibacter xylanolyticus]|uniref:Protein-L-isoaspartate O-methyltransferase n=1 Tax=Breznakibacter xylanolyticus TaxID=990 RepID=A0A2W7NJZ9_9BACT|nr:protein-L-isoaspartate(D-aspartate) O-methyltransferase [Breznakibacter xylanolyticus]MBN2742280.1 protein-L-isoaspartate(D-aspartate) O-methyltransferase [Marinilabiliaceae bacterium]PZX20755.1 protein-L-isoaspartate(D-aspartate) O-methyltransferase [Breznakibacter xylanolyticus]